MVWRDILLNSEVTKFLEMSSIFEINLEMMNRRKFLQQNM